MDSLTHLAIGACIGELFLGGKLGRRAPVWGAVAHSVPDIDWIAVLWTSPAENLLAHRGITHSFLVAGAITPLLALAAHRWHRAGDIPYRRFLWFFGAAILGHVLIDGLNAYGTAWFEPFSSERIALNVIFVADPFMAIGPALAGIALLAVRTRGPRCRRWAWAGLSWCGLYLCHGLSNKLSMDRTVERLLAQQHIHHTQLLVTPTAFNNWLWFIAAGDGQGFHIGHRSVLDTTDSLQLRYVPGNMHLLNGREHDPELLLLERFSQGFHTVERQDGKLLFNDLRFGQIRGWCDPEGPFTFQYELGQGNDNLLVMQRGRMAGWDRDAITSLVARIRGHQASCR